MTVPILASTALGLLLAVSLGFPARVAALADWLNGVVIAVFGTWFIWVIALATLLCAALALWPKIGRLKLGREHDTPEYSTPAWIAMLFGAGVSAALLKWSVAEPFHYIGSNPDLIQGITREGTGENMQMAMKWAFLHWGFGAWATYAIIGLGCAFVCFRGGHPLTLRSALKPLFGDTLSKSVGTMLNAFLVLATALCVLQILGFGMTHTIASFDYLQPATPGGMADNTRSGVIVAVGLVMALAVASCKLGLHRGLRRVSQLNLWLSVLFLLALLSASSFTGLKALVICVGDYLFALPEMAFRVWRGDETEGSVMTQLEVWQVRWSMFHWTWWIPFAAFVGVFMARISKGRTVREFVLGAVLAPAAICFVWLTWAGGIAIDLHLRGVPGIDLMNVTNTDKLLALIGYLFTPQAALWVSVAVVVLIVTYLVSTVDSALFVMGSLSRTGRVSRQSHEGVIYWAAVLSAAAVAMHLLGATQALQALMCLMALPMSCLIVLQSVSLVMAVLREAGVLAPQDTAAEDDGAGSTLEPAVAAD